MAVELEGFDDFEQSLRDAEPDQDSYAWWVGTAVEYAAYQEFGTSKMRAQPYLRPAIKLVALREKFEDFITDAFTPDIGFDDFARTAAMEVERIAKEKTPVDTGNLMGSIASAPTVNKLQVESADGADDESTIVDFQ